MDAARSTVVLVAVAVAAALLATGSRAAGGDRVVLHVSAASIDGAVTFASSSGWNWRCDSSSCTVTTNAGTTMTMTAQGGSASSFRGWGGACAANGAQQSCTLQVTADTEVSALFSHLRLWLTSFGSGSLNASSTGRSCGAGCADYAPGDRISIYPKADPGWQLTAWGGSCAGVRSDHYCILTLNRNSAVSATFERIPRSDCPPGRSCDPVGPAISFRVTVTGYGTVMAPKISTMNQLSCRSSTTAGTICGVDRPVEKRVYFYARGVRFLGWGGRCSGQKSTTCSFYNRPGVSDTSVTARFG
jgi:hypothetical protein